MRVVILEDDRDIAIMERMLLRPYVDDVNLMIRDFASAFLIDTWAAVDVAVVDLMLPGFHGEDICQFLKDNAPHVRRIICTAKPVYELVSLQELADVILQKPFSAEALVQAVLGHAP